MYAVVGFDDDDAGGGSPDWEAEHEVPTVDAAVAIARNWILTHPAGRRDVIEIVGRKGFVVRVVTRRGSRLWPPRHGVAVTGGRRGAGDRRRWA
jgi:hypothetical protein